MQTHASRWWVASLSLCGKKSSSILAVFFFLCWFLEEDVTRVQTFHLNACIRWAIPFLYPGATNVMQCHQGILRFARECYFTEYSVQGWVFKCNEDVSWSIQLPYTRQGPPVAKILFPRHTQCCRIKWGWRWCAASSAERTEQVKPMCTPLCAEFGHSWWRRASLLWRFRLQSLPGSTHHLMIVSPVHSKQISVFIHELANHRWTDKTGFVHLSYTMAATQVWNGRVLLWRKPKLSTPLLSLWA